MTDAEFENLISEFSPEVQELLRHGRPDIVTRLAALTDPRRAEKQKSLDEALELMLDTMKKMNQHTHMMVETMFAPHEMPKPFPLIIENAVKSTIAAAVQRSLEEPSQEPT